MSKYIFDRTLADVQAKNEKGTYNASDLNRVGKNAETLNSVTLPMGYALSGEFRTDWREGDIPSAEDMEDYLHQINRCKNGFLDVGVPFPQTMDGLDYIGANNIEKMFYEIEQAVEPIKKAYKRCGATTCGGGSLY